MKTENDKAVPPPFEQGVGRLHPKRWPAPRQLRADRNRNSVCAVPLERLDWSNWFTDGTGGGLYLHVWSKDGDTCHRVHCRKTDKPRLCFKGGVLFWLVDPKTPNVVLSGARTGLDGA